jgi:RimJ/RimL family protein N-acetyltransferase
VLRPDYPIVTERLLLRPLDAKTDVDAVHRYASRADVCRYIPFEPRSREDVAAWLSKRSAAIESEGQALGLAVVLRASDELVGDIMLFYRSAEHRGGEIGYVFNPEHHGRGYATEACRALLALAFDGLGLHRIVARVDARNAPSIAVLRRLGMRPEAHLVQNEWFKGEWTDELDFAMLAAEWRRGMTAGSAVAPSST